MIQARGLTKTYGDFAAVDGGFMLPGEAVPVWAGDIDRMFVSLVPPDYVVTLDAADNLVMQRA